MKKYVLFNIIIQILILVIASIKYLDKCNIKFLVSIFLICLVFLASIFEHITKIKLNKWIHYFTTIVIFLFFMFILAK